MRRISLRSLWFQANVLQGCLETIPVMIGLVAMLRWTYRVRRPSFIVDASLIVIFVVCSLWSAVRIRRSSGAWWKQLVGEAATVLAGGVLLPTLFYLVILLCFEGQVPPYSVSFYSFFPVAILAVTRVGTRLLGFWNRKRRESFAVNLANSILMVILIVLLPVTAYVSVRNVSYPLLPVVSPAEWFAGTLTIFLGRWLEMSIVTGLAILLCLLPPAILFSSWVSRRITQRVSTLAQATSEMRKGNYSIRVAVQGEDEVARLQADFNIMATDLDRTVHELQTERDRVAGILQSRRELVAGVSHDLRTPIATIRAHLESVRDVKSVASFETELEILNREVIRLQSLIDDLFALSQAEVNKLTLDLKPLDTGAVVRNRVAAMAPLAWQSGRVQVTADVPAGSPPAIADQRRLEQALTNLIHNAVRHTPPGGVVVVGVSAEIDAVRIDVRDTGEGIAPEDLPHIWDRYYQGKCGAANHGAGLGLVLVKEFAEAMGGTVSVESEWGKGSCFTIRLRCG